MKHDIFNFSRFGKYFCSDLKGCWSNYGLSFVTVTTLPIILIFLLVGAVSTITGLAWDGPDMGFRAFAAILAMVCLVITMPVKCYGRITEKQYGSFWLTLPASRLEKFLSMFIITCIIVPVLGAAIVFGIDGLICAVDATCGNSLWHGIHNFSFNLIDLDYDLRELATDPESLAAADMVLSTIEDMENTLSSRWLYVDDFFAFTLPFLAGAVWFKSGKTVKTILALFAFSTACGIIFTPFMTSWIKGIFEVNNDIEAIRLLLESGTIKNLALVDTISDTFTNLVFIACIWFRIKTLKH